MPSLRARPPTQAIQTPNTSLPPRFAPQPIRQHGACEQSLQRCNGARATPQGMGNTQAAVPAHKLSRTQTGNPRARAIERAEERKRKEGGAGRGVAAAALWGKWVTGAGGRQCTGMRRCRLMLSLSLASKPLILLRFHKPAQLMQSQCTPGPPWADPRYGVRKEGSHSLPG